MKTALKVALSLSILANVALVYWYFTPPELGTGGKIIALLEAVGGGVDIPINTTRDLTAAFQAQEGTFTREDFSELLSSSTDVMVLSSKDCRCIDLVSRIPRRAWGAFGLYFSEETYVVILRIENDSVEIVYAGIEIWAL